MNVCMYIYTDLYRKCAHSVLQFGIVIALLIIFRIFAIIPQIATQWQTSTIAFVASQQIVAQENERHHLATSLDEATTLNIDETVTRNAANFGKLHHYT